MSTDKTLLETSGPAALAAVVLVLGALGWLALGAVRLPAPSPANAPATQFSAQRAFAHVQALTSAPRPIASPANAQARQYIVQQLRALGLEPEVQTTTVQKKSVDPWSNVHVTLAVVHNIVVHKAGAAPDHAQRPALLLATHYDSGERTLGAAGGGASVAAMLETLRALQAAAPLANDVLVLFADGEKTGALGAQGFVEEHPWARRAGLVLKFDNAGNRGPFVLYDSSGADSATIGGWARSVPQAHGSSLMREVYKLMPNALDMGPLARLDAPLLQFANVEGKLGELGSLDTPDRLDRAMLQHEGDTMLGLARHFGQVPLAHNAGDGRVYFSMPGLGVFHYSAELVWPFTRLACLLLVGVCCLAVQRRRADPIQLAQGTFGFALIAGALAAGAWLLWQNVPMLHTAYHPLAIEPGAYEHCFLLGFAALGSGLFIFLQRRLQQRIGTAAAALGALLCMTVALVAVSWRMPGASYLLAWPLFAAMAMVAALFSRRVAALPLSRKLPLLLAGVAPGVIMIVPVVRETFTALTPQRMNLPIALLTLLLGLSIVLLASVARRCAVRGLALAGLGCLAVAGSASPYRGELPQPNRVVYYKDMPTWRAWWLMPPVQLDGWTRQIFPNAIEPNRFVDVFGWDSDELWHAPAPRTDVAFPYTEMLKNEEEPHRHVEFVVQSKNRAPNMELWIEGAKPVRTSVNGRVLTDEKSRHWALSLYGMEGQRLHFAIDLESNPTFQVRVQERIPGLPERELPPRPATARPVLTPMTGTTIAADTLWFR
jgi:hypothetical protein